MEFSENFNDFLWENLILQSVNYGLRHLIGYEFFPLFDVN